ncbi:ATP-binding protein [Candidatus Phytoplasma sacchari]|uniref:ATP-binding protein n=1 Tax=Candidatus Phytoplasma sacchari TaxID=2609813 RepID=A0ABY7M2S9_9MOLU|nr:ATP-binding protein [Candidatus Phytoplasma sacchari]
MFPNKQYLDKIRSFILEHDETKDLKIQDQDLLIVYNYLENKNQIMTSGYRMVLKIKPYVHVVFKETSKVQKMHFENDLQKANILFNQNIQFIDIQLNKLKIKSPFQEKVFNQIQFCMTNFHKIKKGFYLHGPFNIGKTFLLKILAKNLIKKKISLLFLFMPDLVRQFKTWYNEAIENKLNYLKKIPCLILDDLGSENMNDFFRDDIFLSFLYYRYENKLPTFFSSNLDLFQLEQYFASQKDCNSEIKSNKIINLIKSLTDIYAYDE